VLFKGPRPGEISLLTQFPDHRAGEPKIKQRDKKNNSETQGHDNSLIALKVSPLATPIQKEGRKADRDALQGDAHELRPIHHFKR